MPTVDPNLIHIWPGEIEGYLNNPFSPECPDNFFDAKIRSTLQPDLAQFRGRAGRRESGARALFRSIAARFHRRQVRQKAPLPDHAAPARGEEVHLGWKRTEGCDRS